MLFWKRVEIYCGNSLKEFSELRNSLAAQGIRYDYRIVNIAGPDKRLGNAGINPEYQNMYYLYIHHKDYDRAMYHTSNRHVYSTVH